MISCAPVHPRPSRTPFVLTALAALALCGTGAARAYCDGVLGPVSPIYPDGNVCGTLWKIGSGSQPGGSAHVKICRAGDAFNCSTTLTQSFPDAYGGGTHWSFLFRYFTHAAPEGAAFDLYAWNDSGTDPWGSDSKPLQRIWVDYTGAEGISLSMPPRPTAPTPVYPSGTNVPDHYTVTWKSGLNADRLRYPVQYEVWYKYWPFGGTEPAAWSLSTATLPCHANGSGPDAYNECSTYVGGPQPAGNWKWYVVADLNVSAVVTFPNTIFSTTAPSIAFLQP